MNSQSVGFIALQISVVNVYNTVALFWQTMGTDKQKEKGSTQENDY